MAKPFEEFQPTDLIHTAAMTQVDACEDDKEQCIKINVEAVENLANLCKEFQTRLIHISTDFVFDGKNGPYKEDDEPNPISFYGDSKLKAEQVIEKSGADHAILRTMLLYGITPDMSRSNIVLWARKSLMEEQAIRVVNDQVRCPTLAEDLASASVAAVMKEAKGIYSYFGR